MVHIYILLQPTIVHLNKQQSGGSMELQQKVWDLVQPVLEEWTGHHLSPVSLYGIRLYHNNSILAPHVSQSLQGTGALYCRWIRTRLVPHYLFFLDKLTVCALSIYFSS